MTSFDKISHDNNISNYKGARVIDIEGKIRAARLAGTQLDYQMIVHLIFSNYFVVSFHETSFHEGCALFTDWPCVLECSVTSKLERFKSIECAYQRVVSKYVASWRGIGTDDSR